MGRRNWHTVYTDCGPSAGWRSTEGQTLPWDDEPEFAKLPAFSIRMLAVDWMHCFHLGVCRDLVGASLKLLVRTKGAWYDQRTISLRLSKIYHEVKKFAKEHGKQISIKRLKKSTLNWSAGYPELRASAYDSGVFLAWLVGRFEQNPPRGTYAGLLGCVWTAHHLSELMMTCDVFWTDQEREQVYLMGTCFMRAYSRLAFLAHSRSDKLFKLRPKWHYIQHLVDDALSRPSGRAAGWDMCWWDEDYVKYAMRIYRRVATCTAQESMLRRNLVQVRAALEKHVSTR